MRVIGFDPGYGLTGWGVVTPQGIEQNRLYSPGYGVIKTPATISFAERLVMIQQQTIELLNEHEPDYAVIEKLFLKNNHKTAAEVYQARGVIMATAAGAGCQIIELAPNQIKLMVCGHGQAQKVEIERMVKMILNIKEAIKPDDTADALAGAIVGYNYLKSTQLMSATGVKIL